MHRAWPRIGCAALASVTTAGCTSSTSASDLHPEGPPMIEQVRLVEVYSPDGATNLERLERTVFGFGTHPLATADDAHPVTSAKAAANELRIVIDELLRGNDLEEIQCRYPVDDDVYARVPLGATPDDIVRCAVAQDLLRSQCPGSNKLSVCLCQRPDGCATGFQTDGTPAITPHGESVGVLDRDRDGAADRTRFIAGAVGIACGAITVPIDLALSYWSPSGNQLAPAQGGFDALGPAVVVVPAGALPAGLPCGLTFAPEVVDKDGNQVCAPPDGDIRRACRPGDVGAFTFMVQPLTFAVASPIMDPGQARTADVTITAVAPLDPASLANITVTEGAATSYTSFTATLTRPNEITIHWTPGELAAITRYTITVPTTVTDAFHQPALRPFQLAFTTGAT